MVPWPHFTAQLSDLKVLPPDDACVLETGRLSYSVWLAAPCFRELCEQL